MVAIVPQAIAVGTGATSFEASRYATVHMSDEAAAIVAEGGPASDPVRSMFQTGTVALRLILEAAWDKRHPAAVAYVEGASW
jgi:hypothetical protein